MTQSDQFQSKSTRCSGLVAAFAATVVVGQMFVGTPLFAQDVMPAQPQVTQPQAAQPQVTQPQVPEQTQLQAETPVSQQTPALQQTPADTASVPAPAQIPAQTPVPVAEAPEVVEEPMPNFFADPQGTIGYLLEQKTLPPGAVHDLSPWSMYRQADIVVKAVMLGLVFASLVTWTICVAKSFELAGARNRALGTMRAIRKANSLTDAIERNGDRKGPAARMLAAAREEVGASEAVLDYAGSEGLKERIDASLRRIEAGAGRKIAIGTGLLATIGSTAPFIGLFGTVWGIMNAFIGISKSQTTNLAVVAPGIAEALLATAIGLVAAIPAVMIYNHFSRMTARYKHVLADAAVGIEILVSRDLDFRKVPDAAPVTALRAAAE